LQDNPEPTASSTGGVVARVPRGTSTTIGAALTEKGPGPFFDGAWSGRSVGADAALFDQHEPAARRFNERESRNHGKGRRQRAGNFLASRRSEEQEQPARLEQCLKAPQNTRVSPNAAKRDDVRCFVQLGFREEFLVTRSLDARARQLQQQNGLPEKRGLPRLRFHHGQGHPGDGELQRKSGGAAAGSDVEHGRRRIRDVPRSDERLEQQAIDGLVGIVERGEIDLTIPERQQLVIGGQAVSQLRWQRQAGPQRPPQQTRPKASGNDGGRGHQMPPDPLRRALPPPGSRDRRRLAAPRQPPA